MIQVNLKIDNNKNIQAVELTGHAAYAEAGSDIVCAAVSAHAIATENSLDRLLKLDVNAKADYEDGGYLSFELPSISDERTFEDAQLILSHFELAISVIKDTYPENVKLNYIKQ